MFFFFFNDTATTEIYTLSLHDALPISPSAESLGHLQAYVARADHDGRARPGLFDEAEHTHAVAHVSDDEDAFERSEEHTSELQSRQSLVCRLLLEKKNSRSITHCTDNY